MTESRPTLIGVYDWKKTLAKAARAALVAFIAAFGAGLGVEEMSARDAATVGGSGAAAVAVVEGVRNWLKNRSR